MYVHTQSCWTLCDSTYYSPPGSSPWDFPGKNTGVGCHFLLQGIFLTQGSNLGLLHCRQILYHLSHCSYFAHHTLLSWATRNVFFVYMNSFLFVFLLLLLLLLSCFSHVRLCETPETAAHQAPPSLGFSRQEHWSGLPFPSPMHEREK